jgi:GT2 family glycosyltransferase
MITICLTYFKSLTLANLAAALYSVRRQDLSRVSEVIIVDNDTPDSLEMIRAVVHPETFPVPVRLLSFKHGDPSKAHAWSTNVAVLAVQTQWVLFTRADYLLDFSLVKRFVDTVESTSDWNVFVTSSMRHLHVDIATVESFVWRQDSRVLGRLEGVQADYTNIDSGVWMAQRDAFVRIGGLNEKLSAWGHAQTEFQHRLWKAGTEFVRLDEVLFFHPLHAAPRDMNLANQQLRDLGIDIHELWKRHEKMSPYR